MYMSVCTPELVSQVISRGSMPPDPPGGAGMLKLYACTIKPHDENPPFDYNPIHIDM